MLDTGLRASALSPLSPKSYKPTPMFTSVSNLNNSTTPFITHLASSKLDKCPALHIVQCKFDLNYYHSELFHSFGITLPDSISNSVLKRQAEFLAGRVCANYAMRQLGKEAVITIGKSREPVWPNELIGTITHDNDSALCAVMERTTELSLIGIDREKWIASSDALALYPQILQPQEKQLLEQESDLPFNKLLTLCFSAKESIFKAYFATIGQYFDFKDACLVDFKSNGLYGECQFVLADWLNLKRASTEPVKVTFSLEQTRVTTLVCSYD